MTTPLFYPCAMLYSVLDIFFMVLHSSLILFNLLGWVWKPTRRANLITLLLTGFSWIGLGMIYGLGYCPLTDWHRSVLVELGQPPQTPSYVAYLFQRILNVEISNKLADLLTLYSYLAALILSLIFNFWHRIKRLPS